MLAGHAYISNEDLDDFVVVDDPKKAAQIIVDFRKAEGRAGFEMPTMGKES